MNVSAAALWLNTTFAGFDLGITSAIHKLYELAGGFFTPFLEFFSLLCDPVVIIIIALLLFHSHIVHLYIRHYFLHLIIYVLIINRQTADNGHQLGETLTFFE